MKRRRPGRPPGPTETRAQEPWDPRCLTWRHRRILSFLAKHMGWRRADVARAMGVSVSHLSILANCPAGLAYLRELGVDPTMTHNPQSESTLSLDDFL